jgi:hypothetical protein
MQFSTSKLDRIENAENLIDVHELRSLLGIYGVTADRWPEYFDMLAAAKERGWWRAYGLDDNRSSPRLHSGSRGCGPMQLSPTTQWR